MIAAESSEKFSLADRLLNKCLYRVRPAWLASRMKKILGVRRKVVATPHGRFFLDPVSTMARIGMGGAFEPEMVKVFNQMIKPGAVCVDLGANEGFFTVLAARLAGVAGRVLAVEPQDWLGEVIRRNASLNDCRNVEVVAAAISDREGEVEFYINSDTNSGASGLATLSPMNSRRVAVPSLTLESLLDRHAIDRVNFMKVDIEGGEYDAIFGSRRVFETGRIEAFALEMHPVQIRSQGKDDSAVRPFLESAGYRLDERFCHWVWRRA